MEEKIQALIEENRVLKEKISMMKKIVNRQTLPETVKSIIDTYLNVDIEKNTRKIETVEGRRMYYKYLRNNTRMSYLSIGLSLDKAKRDHTTVMYALDLHDNICDVDKVYAKRYEDVKKTINTFLNAENNRDNNLFRDNEQRQTGE